MPIKRKDSASRGRGFAAGAGSGRDDPPVERLSIAEAFADPRSGLDRRTGSGGARVSRRSNAERRRSRPGKAWWLCRSYVEAHDMSVAPTPTVSAGQE